MHVLTFPTIRQRHGHLALPPARFLILLVGWAIVTGPYVTLRAKADDFGFAHQQGIFIAADKVLGLGETPGQRLQDLLYQGGFGPVEWFALIGHMTFFFVPWVLCIYVALACPKHILSLFVCLALVCYVAAVSFVFLPTEPPWMATDIERILIHHGDVATLAKEDGNRIAAFPSLHVGGPALYAFWLYEHKQRVMGWLFMGIALWIAFAVIYFGEHYTVDAIGGVILAYVAVRLTRRLV